MIVPGATQQFTATPEQITGEWQERTPDYADFLKANVAEGFEHTTTDVALTERQVWEAERAEYGREAPGYQEQFQQGGFLRGMVQYGRGKTPEYIAKEDWNEKHPLYRKGVEWQEQMTPERARIYAEDFDKREFRQMLIEQGKNAYGFWGGSVPGFFAGMLGNLPDPINAIPFGRAVSAGKGVMAGVKTGMVEGALGNAAVDLVVLPDLARRGADVGFADFALDVTFGAFIGGGLGGLGGGLGHWRERRAAKAAETQRAWAAARDAEEAARRLEYDRTHGVFMEAGRDTFLDRAGKGGEWAFDTAPDSFLARNELGDFTRRNLHGADRQTLLNAFALAADDFAAGRPVDVRPILEGSPTIRKVQVEALLHTLNTREFTDVNFGTLRPDYKKALNEIRTEEGVPLLTGNDLIIPANVVKKLHEERMLKNRYTADEVAEVLLNVFHRGPDFAASTSRPHIQALVSLRRQLADIGFISINPKTGDTVIKSGYSMKKDRLEKSLSSKTTPEGRAIPHTVDGDVSPPLAAARLSALQGEQRILTLQDPVNRFAVEPPEDFITAPPVSKEVRSALDEMGVDPKTGMTTEELRAVEQIEQGKAPREEAEAFMREQEAETVREKMEEAGYAALDCILEVIE